MNPSYSAQAPEGTGDDRTKEERREGGKGFSSLQPSFRRTLRPCNFAIPNLPAATHVCMRIQTEKPLRRRESKESN